MPPTYPRDTRCGLEPRPASDHPVHDRSPRLLHEKRAHLQRHGPDRRAKELARSDGAEAEFLDSDMTLTSAWVCSGESGESALERRLLYRFDQVIIEPRGVGALAIFHLPISRNRDEP